MMQTQRNVKKNYKAPEALVLLLTQKDVLTASDGFGNGEIELPKVEF